MMAPTRKLLSIVTPCYNEEANVEECHRAVAKVLAESLPEYDREHIFADNASSDGTVEVLRRLAAEDDRVKVILNARNYGPFRSTFNALLRTSGDAVVVLLAADLQDPPELIVDFARRWEEGYEIVYGIRANREEGLLLRIARSIYYRLVARFADIRIPRNAGEFQLVDRRVVEALRQYDDYYPYIRGMIANSGSRSTGVSYTWRKRKQGRSKNRLHHLVDQALNGLISFTNIPMRVCMFFGFTVSAVSLAYAAFTFVLHILRYRELAQPGIATLVTALFFFSGVQLFFLGVIGEYISAIHFQVRRRPLVLERECINFEEGQSRGAPTQGRTAPVAPEKAAHE